MANSTFLRKFHISLFYFPYFQRKGGLISVRIFTMKISSALYARHFRLVVVGGGAGGLGASHKFARKLPKGAVAVIDPIEKHYYQPGFTLVGGGLMSLEANTGHQKDLIHPNSTWIQKRVMEFTPSQDKVKLSDGEEITYDYMVVATGVQPRFDKIKGLPAALDTPGVCSNYSNVYCEKTFKEIKNFESGNCIFTFPNAPVKCAGAPQKICYIADDWLRAMGKRDKARVIYATSLAKLFGVEKYRLELVKVAEKKGVEVKCKHNLIEVDSERKIAKFELLADDCTPNGETVEMEYSLLHVSPPCLPIPPLQNCQPLTDAAGFIDVKPTLQSKAFPNVFGVGDCMNTPNAKTAAAVSSHLKTVEKNLTAVMAGKEPVVDYDGYASCPLVVSRSRVILAEFNQDGPMETLPVDQSKPRYFTYLMKRYFMPFLYWHGLIKGYWNGPATIRKVSHLGFVPKKK